MANYAVTCLRMLGIKGCPARAFNTNTDSFKANNVVYPGWQRTTHTHEVFAGYFLGFIGNRFEGLYYVGDKGDVAARRYPSLPNEAWTVDPPMHETGDPNILPMKIINRIKNGSDNIWHCIDNELNGKHIGWFRFKLDGFNFSSYSAVQSNYQDKLYTLVFRIIGGKKYFSFEGDIVEFTGTGEYSITNGALTVEFEVGNDFIWPEDNSSYKFVILHDPGNLYIPVK